MLPPRPNTQLAELQSYFLRLSKEGRDMPTVVRVADDLGVTASTLRGLIEDGISRGLWRVVRSNAGILQVYEPGGGWLLNGPAASRRAQPQVAQRKCLRCREWFQPEHGGNWLCTPCGIYAARVG